MADCAAMLKVREAVSTDAADILSLVRELAEYERAPQLVTATEADILRDGFSGTPRFRCLMAFFNEELAGFALYFHNYSTWRGQWGLYLEDLFVRPVHRKRGIGKALFVELARIAVREKCGRFDWQVLDWNTPSIAFYESMGARRLSEWVGMRLDGEALESLASHG
jgi:GNAT superfamily N-acetyltransferase